MASFGISAPALPLFGRPADPAQQAYERFRSLHNRGQLLSTAGALLLVPASFLILDGQTTAGNIGAVLSVGLFVVGSIRTSRAPRFLHEAICLYNATLRATTAGTNAPARPVDQYPPSR